MGIVRPCISGPLRLKKIYRESNTKYAYDWRPQYPATSKKRPRSRSVSRSENVQSVRSDEAETVQAVHARHIVRRLISSRFWRRTHSTPKREKLVKRVKSTDRKSEETWSLLWEGETSATGPTQELRRGAIDEQYADQLAADAEAFFNLPDCDSDHSSWGER